MSEHFIAYTNNDAQALCNLYTYFDVKRCGLGTFSQNVIITVRKRSLGQGNVLFLSVILFTVGRGACMIGEHAWLGGWGACMAVNGVCAWEGACVWLAPCMVGKRVVRILLECCLVHCKSGDLVNKININESLKNTCNWKRNLRKPRLSSSKNSFRNYMYFEWKWHTE